YCKYESDTQVDLALVTSIDDNAFGSSPQRQIDIHNVKNSQLTINFYMTISELRFDNVQFNQDHFIQNTLITKGADKVLEIVFINAKDMIFDSRKFPNLINIGLEPYGFTTTHFPVLVAQNTRIKCDTFQNIYGPEQIITIRLQGIMNQNEAIINLIHFTSLFYLELRNGVVYNEVYIHESVQYITFDDFTGANIRVKVFDYYDNVTFYFDSKPNGCPGRKMATPNALTLTIMRTLNASRDALNLSFGGNVQRRDISTMQMIDLLIAYAITKFISN
ncbi:hypothetical protein GJ496_010955, partial [Pomphorhynchus laevis]